jgi:hypothetical protein
MVGCRPALNVLIYSRPTAIVGISEGNERGRMS